MSEVTENQEVISENNVNFFVSNGRNNLDFKGLCKVIVNSMLKLLIVQPQTDGKNIPIF